MAAGYGDNAYGQNYATGGGAKGGGGGGFFSNSQSPGGGGGAGGARSASTLTMRPVTVRQILNSQQSHTDGEMTIDGVEVGHVTFVGIIRNLARNATNISYNIEDGTGMIDVRTWADNNASSLMPEDDYQTDRYVRVIGSVKNFNGRRNVNAGHIRLVADFNEIFFHKLEAIHTHLLITRGASGGKVKSESQDEMKIDGGDIYGQFDKPIQQAVIKIVHDMKRGDHDENGVSIDVIVRRAGKFNEDEIRETIDELIGEGVFYTGVSDNFILSTI